MISAIFDLIGSLASAFFQVAGALGRAFLDILSALSSAVLWPVRAPLYFVACGVLLAALVFLLACALWVNHRRKKGK